LITLAGPLVNFAIALLLLPVMLLLMTMEFGSFPSNINVLLGTMQRPGLTNLVIYLVATNILLGVFNLLPAFPMDGGRILRALLAMTMPYVRATQIAVLVGRLMAGLLAVWGLFTGNIVLLLIAFFIYVGGGAEREAVESKAVLRYFTAAQALTRSAVNLYASEHLNRAVDLIMNSYQSDFPVLDLTSKFIGVLTRPRLIQALQQRGPEARVVDVMLPAESVPVIAPTTNLSEAWELMASTGSRVGLLPLRVRSSMKRWGWRKRMMWCCCCIIL
jgi:stage IV sporulation protein FB